MRHRHLLGGGSSGTRHQIHPWGDAKGHDGGQETEEEEEVVSAMRWRGRRRADTMCARCLVFFATGGGHEEMEEIRRPEAEEDGRR